jgi:hypothetical protein
MMFIELNLAFIVLLLDQVPSLGDYSECKQSQQKRLFGGPRGKIRNISEFFAQAQK